MVKLAGGGLPGSITVMEDVTPPHHGPPLHAHPFEEWFYILEGSFLFELAGVPFSVGVGDFVHARSNEPHVFQNTSDKNARMLLIAKPGGLEHYFTELAERTMNDPTNVAAISEISVRPSVPQPLRLRWSRSQAVAAHDLRQSCSVWRATGSRVDHLGALAEILRT